MELKFNKIDWRQSPAELKNRIDGNFVMAEKAIKLIADEVKESHPKIETSDDNIIIETPKGISNVHKVKLHSRIEVKKIISEQAELESVKANSIGVKTIESSAFKLHQDGFSVGDFHFNLEHKAATFGTHEEFRVGPYKRTRLRLTPLKDTASYHSIVIQEGNKTSNKQLNDNNVHLVVKGDGRVGMSAFHNLKSTLTLGGKAHSQLTLKSTYTPSQESDDASAGTFAWDEDNIYLKTNDGWKRVSLENL